MLILSNGNASVIQGLIAQKGLKANANLRFAMLMLSNAKAVQC